MDKVISDADVHQARESVRTRIDAMLGNEVCNSPVSKCDKPMQDKHECRDLLPVINTDHANVGLLCGGSKMMTADNSKSNGLILKRKLNR
jgi:hypothetical protein